MGNVIGMDIGHSAVKISASPTHRIIFPSVVSSAITIADEQTARLAERETVEVNGQRYFIGETAARQAGSQVINGLSVNWVETDAHTALFLGAIKKLEEAGYAVDENTTIMLGLPAKYYAQQKGALRSIAQANTTAKIMVMSQPMGAYCAHMIDHNGQVMEGRSLKDESWAVIDVGYFTTDFMVMKEGTWIQLTDASCEAVSHAVQHLQTELSNKLNSSVGLKFCERAFQKGEMKYKGKMVDVSAEVAAVKRNLVNMILDHGAGILRHHVDDLDGFLLAGGGSEVLFEPFKEKNENTFKIQDPRFAVAEGFRRAALQATLANQAKRQVKAA